MDRNEIAVIICNYNGGEDTVKCIDAVIKSKDIECDIYVVDNASTDGSADRIGRQYGERVAIVQNAENLGGSGGFGRGLRMAVEEGYPYIMMLDNDAYVDTDTIKKLHRYLEENPDVGIVGAKIMMSDDPKRIMDYAKTIDFETFMDGSKWCGKLDSEEAKEPRECDFAAATAAMVRREVLLKCGGMDEAHFIYYDDIELGYRIKQSGYKVVSLGSAKAWHKSGMTKKTTNTFARYYLTRNRYRFFAKYLPREDVERFAEYILSRAFSYLYGSYYKGRMDIFDTEKYILEDFIRDRRGKAGDRRINEIQKDGYHLIENELSGCKRILIYPADEVPEHSVVKLCSRLWAINPDIEIMLSASFGMKKKSELCLAQLRDEFKECSFSITLAEESSGNSFDKSVHFCRHVKDITENILPDIYIDIYGNMIANEQDYIYFRNYEKSYEFFYGLYHDSVVETINKIRKEGDL
ncbi:galactofuranosyltransferase GlfT2 [Lachnospiraceae bacterium]|nr:galactofuranosyltransferase GlfT2 [Lachnospiraceae bacterium]